MTRKMLTTAQSIVYLDEVLYHYFIRSGSVTTRENLDCNVEILAAMQDVLEWFQAHGLFERYADELCKLCIDNVLYDASTRILKVVPQHPLLDAFLNFTTQFFPSYRANPYLRTYSKKKKLILSLIGKRQYRAVHLLFCMAQR